MSQENVEVVRRVYDAIARRNTDAVLALYDPDVEWDFSHSQIAKVTATTHYHGHAGLRHWWSEWGDVWTEYEDSYDELIDAGDHVISGVASQGRGRMSGAEWKWRHYGVWTVRDARVVRVVWVDTREEALKVAGLSA